MILLVSAFHSILEFIIFLIVVGGGTAVFYAMKRLIRGKSLTKEIIEAEQNRKECPDIQSGHFTRLYTMPYDEQITGPEIERYCREHFPNYKCAAGTDYVSISETITGLSGETRELYITHLRDENITAIEFKDPHELVAEGRGGMRQYNVRTSLDDKGFSEDIRKIVRHFQSQAVEKAKR